MRVSCFCSSRRSRRATPRRAASADRRAFSLIELLVVIAVVTILDALLNSAVRQSREAARAGRDQSTLQQCIVLVLAYAHEHHDLFPVFTRPDGYGMWACGEQRYVQPYFGIQLYWHAGLAPWAGLPCNAGIFYSVRADTGLIAGFQYSSTLLADTGFWNELTRTGPDQWRVQSIGGVLFPSNKGALLHTLEYSQSLPNGPRRNIGAAFCDGSAHTPARPSMLNGYPHGEGNWPGSIHPTAGLSVLHTIDGVRGVDVR